MPSRKHASWRSRVVLLICCVASFFLPWPGTVLVILLYCISFLELASPASWIVTTRKGGVPKQSGALTAGGVGDVMSRGRWLSPSAALAYGFNVLVDRLWCGGRRDEMGGVALSGPGAAGVTELSSSQGKTKDCLDEFQELTFFTYSNEHGLQYPPATFLKGSLGSFSRGGLIVTHEGRVIYKVNQDRGLISHPALNPACHAIFGIFDGHGENGELVAAYTMQEVPKRMARHSDAVRDPASALRDVFQEINSCLPDAGINALFGGCTAVVVLVRGQRLWVANVGDSRALVASRREGGVIVARGLTRDQKPDSPVERERIEAMGGFVSDPEEAGASARVWLDETKTLIGLAMARSIGDLAVERVGVISLPEVTEYELTPQDEFLILASDGVWDFIDNQEAAEVVHVLLEKGEDAAGACKGLMELANRRWSDMVGDYRDDITATVVRLPFLPPADIAAAAAVNAIAKRKLAADDQPASHGRAKLTAHPSDAQGGGLDSAVESLGPNIGGSASNLATEAPSGSGEGLAAGTKASAVAVSEVAAATEGDGAILTLTPTVAPEDDDDNGGKDDGSDSCGGGEGDKEETVEMTRLLSAISEAIAAKTEVSECAPVASTATPDHAMVASAQNDDDEEKKKGEGDEGEEWEWDFGARDNREPSREMREASREFSSGSLHALAVGRKALEDD